MSIDSAAALLLPEPAGRPAPRETRPSLRPVAAPAVRRRPKLAYALIALGGAVAIAVAQIGLSLAITQDSFVLADLHSQQRELDLEAQAIQEELTGLSSPQLLAAKADALGLVVAGSASYLRLSDGAVIGADMPADWRSTVAPNGPAAVSNALLEQAAAGEAASGADGAAASGVDGEAASGAAGETGEATGADAAATAPANIPPPITDGLPAPTTR